MALKTPQLGVKMSPQDAKGYVDQLNAKALERWEERVNQGAFMTSQRRDFASSDYPSLLQKLGRIHG